MGESLEEIPAVAAVEAIACDPSFRDCNCPPGQLLDEMLAANQGLVPRLD